MRHVVLALRGLITLGETLRPLAPERDMLLDGLKDFRIAKMIGDFHGIVDPLFWFGRMDRIMAVMISAPKKVDDVLSALSAEAPARHPGTGPNRRPIASLPAWLVPALLLSILLLVADANVTPLPAAEWKEPLTVFLFLILGGLLLKGIAASHL